MESCHDGQGVGRYQGDATKRSMPRFSSNICGIVSRITSVLQNHQISIAALPVAEFPLRLSVVTTALLMATTGAKAQDTGVYREIETKYIFGFTEGSGIGLEGEKEVSTETVAGFGKRDGRYGVSETELEYEFTPNQYVQIELGPLMSTYNISNVTGLDNRNQLKFDGFFTEFRYLVIERGPSSPLAVTLSAEPEWHSADETSGAPLVNYELEAKINADLELIPNRMFLGSNVLYEPETSRVDLGVWQNELTVGASMALAYRITPSVTVGAEAWYLRHYDSIGFSAYTGDAVFVGPTMYVQITAKAFMTAAWNAQVTGRDINDNGETIGSLNLTEFTRQRAKLKFAVEF